MAYQVYLGPVMLPVTPSAMTVSVPGANETVTLINDGEVNILHDPGLKEVSFSALLPRLKHPWANGTGKGIAKYMEALMARRLPFPFVVSRMSDGGSWSMDDYTYMLATIEELTMEEDAENGSDTVVALRLKEFREYGTMRVQASKGADGKTTYTAQRQRSQSHMAEVNALAGEVGG